ncbi:MAG: PadR family transcriptional regulator [Longimicrobiales bacterium]
MGRRLGITTLTILAYLAHRRAYGLDIVDGTGLLPGTVYTTLRRLEKKGFVEGTWEDPAVAERERRPRRRYYTLLADGAEALRSAKTELSGVFSLERMRDDGGAGRREA